MALSPASPVRAFNPFHWLGWWIGAAAAWIVREIDFLWHRTKTASGSDRASWLWRAFLSTILVTAESWLFFRVLEKPDSLVALCVSWILLPILPRPVPRFPLLAARFLAFGTTMPWLSKGLTHLSQEWSVFKTWENLVFLICTAAAYLWVFMALRTRRAPSDTQTFMRSRWTNVPTITFADAGGAQRVKEEIRRIAENRFAQKPAAAVRNGILLHGPQGTGKNLLAEATAGEHRVNFFHVRCPELVGMYLGESSAEIRRVFEWAAANRPIVLFLDEIDSIGSRKQEQGRGTDSGGAGREQNAIATQLMQSIDQYRSMSGILIMAATNYLDGLEPTLVRDGRFDAKLRLDLPNESERQEIVTAQLKGHQARVQDVSELARRTPGWSPARLKSLVDRAALAADGKTVEERDLIEALEQTGGHDRAFIESVRWEDVVLPQRVVDDLKTLLHLMEPGRADRLSLPVPTGLILTGAPGSGKTLTARLIASQAKRSFYPLTPSDILSGTTGGSVQKLRDAFQRAKEHAPSILFFDELDGLFPRLHNTMGQHDLQLVEQALIEISALKAEHNVFLIGTTNYLNLVDPRILRGGRFSEKIEIGLPDDDGYRKLIVRHLSKARLAEDMTVEGAVDRMRGLAPADLEAVITTAKRLAMHRMDRHANELPPLEISDFEEALDRVQPSSSALS